MEGLDPVLPWRNPHPLRRLQTWFLRGFRLIQRPLAWTLVVIGAGGFICTWPLRYFPADNPTIATCIGWALVFLEGVNLAQAVEEAEGSEASR